MCTYEPKKIIIDKLKETGTLPVVDQATSSKYDEMFFEYIVPGNTAGELSTLTSRSYNSTLIAETHGQAYVLQQEFIKKAIQIDPDPVCG